LSPVNLQAGYDALIWRHDANVSVYERAPTSVFLWQCQSWDSSECDNDAQTKGRARQITHLDTDDGDDRSDRGLKAVCTYHHDEAERDKNSQRKHRNEHKHAKSLSQDDSGQESDDGHESHDALTCSSISLITDQGRMKRFHGVWRVD
jgi:hypothetical protein